MDIEVPVDGRDAFRFGITPHRWSVQTTELFLGETQSRFRTYKVWHEAVEVQVTPERLRIHVYVLCNCWRVSISSRTVQLYLQLDTANIFTPTRNPQLAIAPDAIAVRRGDGKAEMLTCPLVD
jgi:hypothetical protein